MRNIIFRSAFLILFDVNLLFGLQVAAFCIIFFALMNICLHSHASTHFQDKPFSKPLYTFQGKTLNLSTSQYVAFYNFTRKKFLGRELHLSMTSPLHLRECLQNDFGTLSRSCESGRLICDSTNTSEYLNHQTEALLHQMHNKDPKVTSLLDKSKSQSAAGVSYAPSKDYPKHSKIRTKTQLDSNSHIKQEAGLVIGEQEFFSAKSDTNSVSSLLMEISAAKVNDCKVVFGLPPVPRSHDDKLHKEVETSGNVDAETLAQGAVMSETASTQTTTKIKRKKICHTSDLERIHSKNKPQKKIKKSKKSIPKKDKESPEMCESICQLDGKKSLSNHCSAKSSSTLDTSVFYDFVEKKTVKFSSIQKDEAQIDISPRKEELHSKPTAKEEAQQKPVNSRGAEERHPKPSTKEEAYSKPKASEKMCPTNASQEDSYFKSGPKEAKLKSPSKETSLEYNTKKDMSQTYCKFTKLSPSKIIVEKISQGSMNSVPKLKVGSKEDIHTSCHHCMFRHRKHISKIHTGKQCALTAEIPSISHQSHTRLIESAFNEDRAKLCLNAAKALLLLSQDNYKSKAFKTKEVKKRNVMTSPIPLTPPNSAQINNVQAAAMLTAGCKDTMMLSKTPTSLSQQKLDLKISPQVFPYGTLQNDIRKPQHVAVKTFSAESSSNGNTFGLAAQNKTQHELECINLMTRNDSPQLPPQRKRPAFPAYPSSSDWSFEITCLIDS